MPAAAAEEEEKSVPVTVYLDGEKLYFSTSAYKEEDDIYVPAVRIARYLGADEITTKKDKRSESFLFEKDGEVTEFISDQEYVEVGEHLFKTNNAYISKRGIVMIPLRPLCAAAGIAMGWNGITKSVFIDTTETVEPEPAPEYDDEDLYWLSRIITAEARGECMEGKIAVGNVIMNRLRHPYFPDTVKEVIFDRKGGIQFSPTHSGAIYNKPTEESIVAAKLVLDGVVVTDQALYFSPVYRAERSWAGRNRPFDMQIEGHVFYR